MSCVVVNVISFTMVHGLKYLEYNNDYIIARDQPSLLSISLQAIYVNGVGWSP